MRKIDNNIMKRIIHHTKRLIKHPHAKKVAWGSVALTTALLVVEFATFDKTLDLHSGKAASTTGTLTATANVASTCTVSGNTMAFGAYTGAVVDQTGIITANCTKGTNFSVAMTSAQTGGFYEMASGANILNYKVYSNNARTTEIVQNTVILTDNNASGNNQNTTIYGRIPAAQVANIGAYSGTTTFTLTY